MWVIEVVHNKNKSGNSLIMNASIHFQFVVQDIK